MEKFRRAQAVVRENKERLDRLKADTLQKVDVLATSRTGLLADLAGDYARALATHYERSAHHYAELSGAALASAGADAHYEIDVLRILNDPVALALEKQRARKKAARAVGASATPPPPSLPRDGGRHPRPKKNGGVEGSWDEEGDEIILQLEDIELADEASTTLGGGQRPPNSSMMDNDDAEKEAEPLLLKLGWSQ